MSFLLLIAAIYGLLMVEPFGLTPPSSRPFIALGIGMICTGVEHIVNEASYELMMQDWIPNKPLVIRLSVVVRILAGIGLFFPSLRGVSATACLVLYFIVLPVNIRVAFASQLTGLDLPTWRRWARLVLHAGWLAWCFWCVRLAAK